MPKEWILNSAINRWGLQKIMPQLDTVNMNCTGFHSNWESDTIFKV
jgi:hypothetical protein